MPLNPNTLSGNIHSLLRATPIGQSPVTAVDKTSNADGTITVKTSVGSMQDIIMPDPMAQVIADAVAKAVIAYFQTEAVIVGTCPPGTAGGPLLAGKIT